MGPTKVGSFDTAGYGDEEDAQSEVSEARSFDTAEDDPRQAPDMIFLDESNCRGKHCKANGVWCCCGKKLGTCRSHVKLVADGTQGPVGFYEPITTGKHTDGIYETFVPPEEYERLQEEERERRALAMTALTGSAGWIAAGPGEEGEDEDDRRDAKPAAKKLVPSSGDKSSSRDPQVKQTTPGDTGLEAGNPDGTIFLQSIQALTSAVTTLQAQLSQASATPTPTGAFAPPAPAPSPAFPAAPSPAPNPASTAASSSVMAPGVKEAAALEPPIPPDAPARRGWYAVVRGRAPGVYETW